MILLSETPAGRFEFDPIKHEYFMNQVKMPGFTEIATDNGLIDYSAVPQGNREKGLKRGKRIHKVLELYDQNDLVEASVMPSDRGYLEAYKRFRADTGFLPYLVENSVYSGPFWYACTLDRAGRFPGFVDPILIDIKTGPVERWTGIQLCSHELALEEGPHLRYGLQVRADGSFNRYRDLVPFPDPQDMTVWKACVTMYHYRRRQEKWKK